MVAWWFCLHVAIQTAQLLGMISDSPSSSSQLIISQHISDVYSPCLCAVQPMAWWRAPATFMS